MFGQCRGVIVLR